MLCLMVIQEWKWNKVPTIWRSTSGINHTDQGQHRRTRTVRVKCNKCTLLIHLNTVWVNKRLNANIRIAPDLIHLHHAGLVCFGFCRWVTNILGETLASFHKGVPVLDAVLAGSSEILLFGLHDDFKCHSNCQCGNTGPAPIFETRAAYRPWWCPSSRSWPCGGPRRSSASQHTSLQKQSHVLLFSSLRMWVQLTSFPSYNAENVYFVL